MRSQNTKKQSFVYTLKKFWRWLNTSDSILATIVWLVIIYVSMRYVLYPTLGFFLKTPYPIVAVVSRSMEHKGSFEEWWNSGMYNITQSQIYGSFNITLQQFKSFPFPNGLKKGDVILLYGKSPEEIEIGDVIVFSTPSGKAVIHRCVAKWNEDDVWYFTTKGDANLGIAKDHSIQEFKIHQNRLLGVAFFRIPYLGLPKAWLEDLLLIIKNK
ncbi:MAG: signal peptidase I [Candidatus Woesearchaeota archaeon]